MSFTIDPGDGHSGLRNLVWAAHYIETGSLPHVPGARVSWDYASQASRISRRRGSGRKRAGKISRTQHNQLEKDRRANLRDSLEGLAELLKLDDQKPTTLLVLETATTRVQAEKDKEAKIQKELAVVTQRNQVLKQRLDSVFTKIAEINRQISVAHRREHSQSSSGSTCPQGPPSPPNSEHSTSAERAVFARKSNECEGRLSPETPSSCSSSPSLNPISGDMPVSDGNMSADGLESTRQSHFTFSNC